MSALALTLPLHSHAQVNAEQVLNIGRNVLSMEDYLLAIQYFNLAIKAKPYLADAYFFRGLAKLSLALRLLHFPFLLPGCSFLNLLFLTRCPLPKLPA